jgi:hypothetical protein
MQHYRNSCSFGVLDDALNISHYAALNNELESMWMEAVVA